MKPTNTVASKTDNRPSSGASLIYNPTFRSVVFQAIAICALFFFFYTIVNNALSKGMDNRKDAKKKT